MMGSGGWKAGDGVTSYHQALVYQMKYSANTDLAMILPIPTPIRSHPDAVKFHDLSNHNDFFQEMDDLFPVIPTLGMRGLKSYAMSDNDDDMLEVHDVGDYQASFVPHLDDFDRLDARFKLPREIWESIPDYSDYGFVVFKLKATPMLTRRGDQGKEVHPMAFVFENSSDLIFIPTMHIHDGQAPAIEEFDHSIYVQTQIELPVTSVEYQTNTNYLLSKKRAKHGMKPNSLVDANDFIYRRRINGKHRNGDIHIPSK